MNELNDVQIALLAARTLIADPECWTQGVYARDASGKGVANIDSEAACFCGSGAIWFAVGYENLKLIDEAHWALGNVIHDSVVTFNDSESRTHAEVLAAFDRAIELAGQS